MSGLIELTSEISAQALARRDLAEPAKVRSALHSASSVECSATTPSMPARGGLTPKAAQRICAYIDDHIGQRISIELLANVANLSVCYFVRAFKVSMMITPHEYVMRRRVERTLRLLWVTDMSLSEIALAAGFADQSHFARRFRRHTGMTPRAYRWLVS